MPENIEPEFDYANFDGSGRERTRLKRVADSRKPRSKFYIT